MTEIYIWVTSVHSIYENKVKLCLTYIWKLINIQYAYYPIDFTVFIK